MHTNPEVLALLALGEHVGTTAERDHATTCPACSEEVAELARIADVGRSSPTSDPLSAPSPEVWHRITAELGFHSPGLLSGQSPVRSDYATAGSATTSFGSGRVGARESEALSSAGASRRTSAARRFGAMALAAAVALIVGIGVGIGYERRVAEPVNRVIASAELRPLPKFAGVSGTAEVLADGRGGRELVVTMTSPEPIDGTVQVWLLDSQGKATSMGTLKDGKARLPIRPGMSLFERPTIDVSDEPAQDADPSHSGDTILRGTLV